MNWHLFPVLKKKCCVTQTRMPIGSFGPLATSLSALLNEGRGSPWCAPSSPGPPPLGARGVGMAEGWGTEQSPRSRTWLPFSQVLGPELKDGGLCKESSFCTALGPGCGGGEYLEGLPGVTGGSALRAGADLHHLPRGAGHAPTVVRLGCGLLRHAADPGHRQCRE